MTDDRSPRQLNATAQLNTIHERGGIGPRHHDLLMEAVDQGDRAELLTIDIGARQWFRRYGNDAQVSS